MDLGLYNLKYPARRALEGLLPLCRDVSPNALSWSLLPAGAAAAACYGIGAARGAQGWLLAGAALVLLRMLLGTLDGLVAVRLGRSTRRGELVNRIAPELCDAMLLGAIAAARPDLRLWAVGALASAWLTSFAGLLGAVIGKPAQSVGPVGQTDRLAALLLLPALAAAVGRLGWSLDWAGAFLAWCALGGAATALLRLRRHLRAAEEA